MQKCKSVDKSGDKKTRKKFRTNGSAIIYMKMHHM